MTTQAARSGPADRSSQQDEASSPAARIRVLIVDDHALFRLAIREHLEANELEVIGEAEDGERAVTLAVQTNPDVVLMDTWMQGASSVEATRKLRVAVPTAEVLMLAASADREGVDAVMASGSGCVLKDEAREQIVAAIVAAAAGECPLSPRIASALIRRVREREPRPVGTSAPVLTTRERQVLGLIAEGRDNNEIAAELVISPETVKTHVSAILEKLHVDNRVQAAVAAVSAGLVTFRD
jgi:two-component system, NarL family, response regulator LiaR